MNEIRYGNFVPFEGILDGKGHTISSLSIENSTNYAGLFHTIGEKGTVKNLVLENVFLRGSYAGGVAAQNY